MLNVCSLITWLLVVVLAPFQYHRLWQKFAVFNIIISWSNSKINTISIELSNNQKNHELIFLAFDKLYMITSTKYTLYRLYQNTTIETIGSTDIENRIIITYFIEISISKISNLQTILNLQVLYSVLNRH